ncbi:hypothetical protein ILUMI_19154 [Ignelater luminosus]|uniref:Uncharacterized protein n=1 Tax=Ignelater luminosus TaxID=2038154 RepID=A0A8K0CGP4_IGNLU|nr:hypothetical protein ILUMI_19154 [Ignelater luminosus]
MERSAIDTSQKKQKERYSIRWMIESITTYGGEMWPLTNKHRDKIRAVELDYMRRSSTGNSVVERTHNLIFGHIQENVEIFERNPDIELKHSYLKLQKEQMQILYENIKEKEISRKENLVNKLKNKSGVHETKTIDPIVGYEHLKPRVKNQQKFKPINIVSDDKQSPI